MPPTPEYPSPLDGDTTRDPQAPAPVIPTRDITWDAGHAPEPPEHSDVDPAAAGPGEA